MKSTYTITLFLISMLVLACSKSKSHDPNLNDPILGTWRLRRDVQVIIDSTQLPVVPIALDTTYTTGYGFIEIFKSNNVLYIIDSLFLSSVVQGYYSDVNGQLV